MGKKPVDGITVSPFAGNIGFIVDDIVKQTVSVIKKSDEGAQLIVEMDEDAMRGAVYLQVGKYAMKKAKELDAKLRSEKGKR
jgi:hypothetical protein